MQIHHIGGTKKRTAKRVGRGGKRGTFSGRGTKGQKARSGRRIRPQLRDILKKIPKKRGYRFQAFRDAYTPVNIQILEKNFSQGDTVNPALLIEKDLLKPFGKKVPKVKILGTGTLSKKLSVEGCYVSESAKEKIEKAGGSVATLKSVI